MGDGAMADVRNSFAQDCVGERSRAAFAEKPVAKEVGDRVAAFPVEVDVRDAAGHIFDVDEERLRWSSRRWGRADRGWLLTRLP